MNPARSFGPDLARGDFTGFWIYLVGPTPKALIAVGTARVLRGPGGGAAAAARGRLRERLREL